MSKAARRKPSGRPCVAEAATLGEIGATLERVESVVQDPDYPVKHREVKTTITLLGANKPEPIDADKLAAFEADLSEYEIPNRIQNAQQRLPQIVGYPEHDEAATLLRIAEDLERIAQDQSLSWAQRNNAGDKAHDALDWFAQKLLDGLRRKNTREARMIACAYRSEGGKARAQNRREELADRDKRILDDRGRMLSGGAEPHEIAGKLAAKYRRDASTIRRIFKKAGVS